MTLKASPLCPRQVAQTADPTARVLTLAAGPPAPQNQGGGDMNGTRATSILHSQSGTAADRIGVPRLFHNSGNWCGTI